MPKRKYVSMTNSQYVKEIHIGQRTSASTLASSPLNYQSDVEGELDFSLFKNLKRLVMRNVKLRSLEWMRTLPRGLEWLDCNFNDFHGLELPIDSLNRLDLGRGRYSLRGLGLGGNGLTGLLPRLELPNVSYCRLFSNKVWQYSSASKWQRAVATANGATSYIPSWGTNNNFYTKGFTGLVSNFSISKYISYLNIDNGSLTNADREEVIDAMSEHLPFSRQLNFRFHRESTASADLISKINNLRNNHNWTINY